MLNQKEKNYYKKLDLMKLSNDFMILCDNGRLETVKYLLTSPELKSNADIHIHNDRGLLGACQNNHIELVKYLLTSTELTEHADLFSIGHRSFIGACDNGNLEIVEYLFNNFYKKPNKYLCKDNGKNIFYERSLVKACSKGHLEIVRYLFKIVDVDIHHCEDKPLYWACYDGHLDIVKYLLTSPELKEHANIYARGSEIFDVACISDNKEIAQYLIFDYKIEKTLEIAKNLIDNKDIQEMFEKREFQEKLQINLNNKKIKVNHKI